MIGINTAVAGVGLGLAVPINATTRRIIYALMHDGRVRRGYLGLVTAPGPLPPEWARGPGQRTGAPGRRGGRRQPGRVQRAARRRPRPRGGGRPLGDAQSLQRLLFEESIGSRMEITVLRNGALVDAVAVPAELPGLTCVNKRQVGGRPV